MKDMINVLNTHTYISGSKYNLSIMCFSINIILLLYYTVYLVGANEISDF